MRRSVNNKSHAGLRRKRQFGIVIAGLLCKGHGNAGLEPGVAGDTVQSVVD
jgi:hypothetical protein